MGEGHADAGPAGVCASVTRFPFNPIGIGSLLASHEGALAQWSVLDEALATSLWRAAQFWKERDKRLFERLGPILQVGSASRLLQRESHDESRIPKRSFRLLVHELRTLVRIVDEQSRLPTPIEELLWRFKLCLEVMNPDGHKKYKRRNEIYLQKTLCEHLVRSGALAVGTKFGSAESDVVAKLGHAVTVIEAKRLSRPPTRADLAKWLVQLQTYMSQAPLRIRGALVLFNVGDFMLTADPSLRVAGRWSVLTINLLAANPSAQRASYELRAVDDAKQPLEVICVDARPLRARARAVSRTAAQKAVRVRQPRTKRAVKRRGVNR